MVCAVHWSAPHACDLPQAPLVMPDESLTPSPPVRPSHVDAKGLPRLLPPPFHVLLTALSPHARRNLCTLHWRVLWTHFPCYYCCYDLSFFDEAMHRTPSAFHHLRASTLLTRLSQTPSVLYLMHPCQGETTVYSDDMHVAARRCRLIARKCRDEKFHRSLNCQCYLLLHATLTKRSLKWSF